VNLRKDHYLTFYKERKRQLKQVSAIWGHCVLAGVFGRRRSHGKITTNPPYRRQILPYSTHITVEAKGVLLRPPPRSSNALSSDGCPGAAASAKAPFRTLPPSIETALGVPLPRLGGGFGAFHLSFIWGPLLTCS
jgi:hypothetical protein